MNNNHDSDEAGGRHLLFIRHGERIDFTLNQDGESWIKRAFDANGKYVRFNINMPKTLPTRRDGYQGYYLDTPLTEIGYLQAKITGRALKDAGVSLSHIYSSPALRCVQTAVGLVKGMNNTALKINIEPALFEWGAWFRPKLPRWLDIDELTRLGYPINTTHVPCASTSPLSSDEKLVDYYHRSFDVVKRILGRHSHGSILCVAHGASLDTCTRELTGGAPRESNDFFHILHRTPYLACIETSEDSRGAWSIVGSPILPMQHQQNTCYDYRQLITNDRQH